MCRRSVLAALAGLALVLAGCSAIGGAGSTPTVTPAPVPEATPTGADPTGFAPGVGEDGSVDPTTLARTHGRRLTDSSYTVNQTIVERRPNGTVVSRYETRGRFGGDSGRFLVVLEQRDRLENGTRTRTLRRFGDREHVYRSDGDGGNRTVERFDAGEVRNGTDYRETLTNQAPIARAFGLVETSALERLTRDGTALLRVGTARPTTVPPLENVSLVATVSERGVLHSYRVTYEVERGGQRTLVTVSLSYTDIGETTVPRPGWVDRGG